MGNMAPGHERPGAMRGLCLASVAYEHAPTAREAVIHVRTAHMFQPDLLATLRIEGGNEVPAARAMSNFHDRSIQ